MGSGTGLAALPPTLGGEGREVLGNKE